MADFLKDYEPVEARIHAFYADNPEGRITTQMIHAEDGDYIFKAAVWRQPELARMYQGEHTWRPRPDATGYAHDSTASLPNNMKASALEVCETSAIGRALANLGYAAKGKRPSREEMSKSADVEPGPAPTSTGPIQGAGKAEADGSEANQWEVAASDPHRTGDPSPPVQAGGESEPDGAGPGKPPPASPALSSQTKQLLRHAADLRWTDFDIEAALQEAYPGMTSLRELDQEQARELIREWAKLVAATHIRPEQRDRLKTLASTADAVRRAQVLFDADVVKNIGDLTLSEAEKLIADLEQVRAEQGAA